MHSTTEFNMERLKSIGLSKEQQNAVRSLVLQGKIQAASFAAFSNDQELAESLVNEISAHQPQT